jgi:lipopolysaccharide export system protein LptC
MNALSAAPTMHESSGSPFVGAGTDRARVFRAAARHSRWVRFFRAAIPISLLLTLAMVVAAPYISKLPPLKLPIDPGRLVLSGTKITMEAPRLGGYTRDGRPYDLTARAAAQDLTNPDVLELTDVHAVFQTQDKAHVELNAAAGVYNSKVDLLTLRTDIVLTSSTGYSARLNQATVDIKKNLITSDEPVEVTMSSGTVNANRLEVTENGDLIRFDSGVEVNLVPASPSNGAAGPGAPPARSQ